MTGTQKVSIWAALVLLAGAAVAAYFFVKSRPPMLPPPPVQMSGVVLMQDSDPKNQLPITGATVRAARDGVADETKSDSSGLFQLTLPASPERKVQDPTTLTFTREGYQPLEITVDDPHKLFLARLTAIPKPEKPIQKQNETLIENVRVRYSEKASFTSDSGTLVKPLEVPNTSTVPCSLHLPCSPDGRWKATLQPFSIDAPGNEFRNIRISCIAGPCPFSKIQSQQLVNNGHTLKLAILNWSDTVTYLLEAEISRTVVSDMVRESYPVIFGSSMSFTLPASAQGLSLEAEQGGQGNIVFPLGPELKLSWAICSERGMQNNARFYRCDLKPGFRFKQ